MSKNKYYAVVKGRQPGIYTEWFGPDGAEAQVKGVNGAVFKGFPTLAEAESWYAERSQGAGRPALISASRTAGRSGTASAQPPTAAGIAPTRGAPKAGSPKVGAPSGGAPVGTAPSRSTRSKTAPDPATQAALQAGQVVIFTDGACTGNPGPGGYGAVLLHGAARQELSGGYRRTTNNRMEMMACIAALESLKPRSQVLLYSDSKYVVDAITKGWARRWKRNGWMRTSTEPAVNPDLWARLLDLLDRHDVQVSWVRGHAGVAENERCDQLSVAAAHQKDLPRDEGYGG